MGEIAPSSPGVGVHTGKVPYRSRVVVLSFLVAKVLVLRTPCHVVWARVASHCYLQRCHSGQHPRWLVAGEIHESWLDGQPRPQDDNADLRLRGCAGYLSSWN